MKKYIVSGLLVLGIIIPSALFAQTLPGDVDPNPNTGSCVNLNNNLRYQSRDTNTNGEVSTLQDFLQSKGYLNNEPTGYFGFLTLKAVMSFQNGSGIDATGYVGPITRAKIKSVTCDGGKQEIPSISSVQAPAEYPFILHAGERATVYGTGLFGKMTVQIGSKSVLVNNLFETNLDFVVPADIAAVNGYKFYVVNSSGVQSNVVSVDVVTRPTSVSVTVLSPNGGETWTKGTIKTIKWEDTNDISTHEIKLVPYYPPCNTLSCPAYPTIPIFTIANTQGSSFSWNVGGIWNSKTDLAPDGSYSIFICQTGTQNCDASDRSFIITGGTETGQKPFISYITPASGPVGAKVKITGTGFTKTTAGQQDVWFSTSGNVNTGGRSIVAKSSDGQNLSFVVPSSILQSSEAYTGPREIKVIPGVYSIGVDNIGGKSNRVNFSVTGSTDTSHLTAYSSNFVGDRSTYTIGQKIKFSVKAMASDGNPGTPQKGFNVQSAMKASDSVYGFVPVQIDGVYQSFNAAYNPSTTLWDVTMTAPSDTSKKYTIDASFYCGNSSAGCSAGQIDKSFSFTLSSTVQPSISSVSPNPASPGNVAIVYGNNLFSLVDNMVSICSNISCGNYDGVVSLDGKKVTFTVPNIPSGVYNLQIIDLVKDYGSTNLLPFTVNSTTQPSITVISPNGGETWTKGAIKTIKWEDNRPVFECPTCGAPAPRYYDISLASYNPPCTTNMCPMYQTRSYKIYSTKNIYYNWSVGKTMEGSTISDGSYTIQVCEMTTGVCDSSDSYFKIISETISQPTITTSSPLPYGTVGASYETPLSVSEGSTVIPTGRHNWGVSSGALPPGLVLPERIAGAVISGVPTTAGTYTFTLTVGYDGKSTSKEFSITIYGDHQLFQNPVPLPVVYGAESFKFTQFLSVGSFGAEVKELQTVLNKAGYNVGDVDGIFGSKVKEALIKFQTANGLKADGIVGYETRSFLNK
jgi:peptidoglycan hydrolase-like protein with peptidoglycan-binding domain